MITPLNLPARKRAVPIQNFNPIIYAYRSAITIPSMEDSELALKALSFASQRGETINLRSPRLKYWAVKYLLDASNLGALQQPVLGNDEAKYILVRRTLREISKQDPALARTTNLLIRNEYSPMFRRPICVPEPLIGIMEEVRAGKPNAPKPVFLRKVLYRVLGEQTDYSLLASRAKPGDRNRIKPQFLKAIAQAHPELYTVAMDEVKYLTPKPPRSGNKPNRGNKKPYGGKKSFKK